MKIAATAIALALALPGAAKPTALEKFIVTHPLVTFPLQTPASRPPSPAPG